MIKRPYPPGEKSKKRRRRNLSEYAKELREKQKLRAWYNLSESQFRRYVMKAFLERKKAGNAPLALIKLLEKRLDNVVFRLGFASSRRESRQLVSHGYFLVNGKKVNIPSLSLKKGDIVAFSSTKKNKTKFKNEISDRIKKAQPPSWLKVSKGKMEGKVVAEPTLDDITLPAEIPLIFEFYSK